MNDFWIQTKFWLKTTLISVLVVYAGLFIYNNTGKTRLVNFWWWFGREPETYVFTLALYSFAAGCLVTLLVGTTIKTMKQFKNARAARLLKELEDERLKAAKLQHKPTPIASPDPEA